MTEVYKVCLARCGEWLSAVPLPRNRYCCRYHLGEWTEAPIGGLFCFDTLPHARHFADNLERDSYRTIILMCQAEEPIDARPSWPSGGCVGESYFEQAWRDQGRPIPLPPGTLLFRRVRPLEVVYA